ncbi:MAG: acetyl-CoA carboxylase biotin carboxyl carrier protein subunit [Bacteroidetes bacterium]|nr:acetyl-CoA carboxylase biotin carboxyl carrier protein subunit [Bacteroidota bacterium]
MDDNLEFVDFKYEEISYRTTVTRKFASRKPYIPPDPKKIIAFIPGTILKVNVKDGAKVKKGDTLLILQAMKMDNHLLSSQNGVVKKVFVKSGEVVPKNHLLIQLK